MFGISDILGTFSFHSQWNAGIIFFSLILIVLYLFLLPTPKDHPKYKSVAFAASMVLLLLTMGSPLNLLGRMLFRAHIFQMILLLLIVAPLIVMGIKTNFIVKLLKVHVAKKIYTFLTNPVFTIILFHLLFTIYHIPAVFDYSRTGYFTNYFFLIGLILAAMLLWWPLISPIPKHDRLGMKTKYIYIVLNIILFVPISLIMFLADSVLYSVFSDSDLMMAALELCLPFGEEIPADFLERLLPYPPLAEQKNGAIILLVVQAMIFAIAAVLLRIKNKTKLS